jgi:uncharacterized membrane protein YbhN (UPF0104 family)
MPRFQLLLRMGISFALVGFLLYRVDWVTLGGVFASANGSLLLLVLFGSPILVVMLAWRLQLVLQGQGVPLPLAGVLRMTWAGQFFNTFLPGTTGGDIFKLYQIGRLAPRARAGGAAAVIIDRLFAMLALALLAGVAVLVEPTPLLMLMEKGLAFRTTAVLVLGLGCGAIVIVLLARGRIIQSGGILSRPLIVMGEVIQVARSSCCLNRRTALAAALALVTHLGNFFAVFLLARALHIQISFGQILLMMPVVLLVIMLPLTINGHGLREMVMIGYFELMHIAGAPGLASPSQMAVALSLVFVANDLCCALPGGLWHLLWPQPMTTTAVPL